MTDIPHNVTKIRIKPPTQLPVLVSLGNPSWRWSDSLNLNIVFKSELHLWWRCDYFCLSRKCDGRGMRSNSESLAAEIRRQADNLWLLTRLIHRVDMPRRGTENSPGYTTTLTLAEFLALGTEWFRRGNYERGNVWIEMCPEINNLGPHGEIEQSRQKLASYSYQE